MNEQPVVDGAVFHVACLCAAWCRVCDEWRAVQQRVAADLGSEGLPLHWHWIDIEDEADLLGDVDVQTFPTIVVVGPDAAVRFAGALQPQGEVLRRVLRACLAEGEVADPAMARDAALQAFGRRLLAV